MRSSIKKIWITGSAGSGKTTLANRIGQMPDIKVSHRDSITWYGNWEQWSEPSRIDLVKAITKAEKWLFSESLAIYGSI